MSNYYNIHAKGDARTFLALFPCLFFFTNVPLAQTVSYNVNSIPVMGVANSVFGFEAFSSNSSGNDNVAVGYRTLNHNISGSSNVANGEYALFSNTNASSNTANGYKTLFSNTNGNNNTATGIFALYSNTIGKDNTANGLVALFSNTTGSSNTAHGEYALYSNTSGNYNTAIGDSAGFHSLGSSNVFIGSKAGFREAGSNKIYIGNDSTKTLLYGDFSSGQILVGKPNATGYVFKGNRTLNVLGGIMADSVRVALSGDWADMVFNKDYPLKPLQELEQYISANKHLPGIPTTREVEANGVNVGAMETNLLEKIEELTLYVLELKKENQQQQEDINKLKSRRK